MLHTSLALMVLILCSGCATTSNQSSSFAPRTSTPIKITKLIKYADNQGCRMLKNGYMICPKSMNR